MNMSKISLATLASFACAAILFAQANSERGPVVLEEQQGNVIAEALIQLERRHQSSLEQLMRRAMQNGDVDTALKVSEQLGALRTPEEPLAGDDTKALIGKWVHKSSSGFVGEDEFLPDGTFRGAGRSGTWKKIGSRIETAVGDYVDHYKLPVRDGKIYGTNKSGAFSILLTKVP